MAIEYTKGRFSPGERERRKEIQKGSDSAEIPIQDIHKLKVYRDEFPNGDAKVRIEGSIRGVEVRAEMIHHEGHPERSIPGRTIFQVGLDGEKLNPSDSEDIFNRLDTAVRHRDHANEQHISKVRDRAEEENKKEPSIYERKTRPLLNRFFGKGSE